MNTIMPKAAGGLRVEGFPIVRVTTSREANSVSISLFQSEIDRCLDMRAPFVVLIDARELEVVPSAIERRKLSEWLLSRREAIDQYNPATAIVWGSKPAELLVRALMWVVPPNNEQFHTSSLVEANRWCRDRLEELSAD